MIRNFSNGKSTKGFARKRQSTALRITDPTLDKIQAYRYLQKAFISPIFLTYYNRSRRLYIDLNALKRQGFTTIIYHINGDPNVDEVFTKTRIQSIIFLSKLLNLAKSNYQPTELEVVGIIQVVKKIRYLIKSS